jgi:hypothetical protein
MVSMLVLSLTTTNASNSTFLQCDISASRTRGTSTQPTAKSRLLSNKTSPFQQQRTSSKPLATIYLHQQLRRSGMSVHANLRLSCPGNNQPLHNQFCQFRGWMHQVRLETTPPLRVATTSNNITSTNFIQHMPLIHQCHTRSNNPFHILTNYDDNDDTVVASNCSPQTPLPSLPTGGLPVNTPVHPELHQEASQPALHPITVHPPPHPVASQPALSPTTKSTKHPTTKGAGKSFIHPSQSTWCPQQ